MSLACKNSASRGLWIVALAGLLTGLVSPGCRTHSPPSVPEALTQAVKQPTNDVATTAAKLPESYFMPYDPTTYRLAVGDIVEISIFGFPETVAVTPVAPDGKLYYLFLDGVAAAGRAPADVENDIEVLLDRMFNHPAVSILPRQFAENRILVIGKVLYPNAYPLESALTLRQAIASAGGLAQGIYRGTTIELASLRDSYLLRNGERVAVDFEALLHRNDASQDIYVRPGDIIVIASGLGREVFLMGAVGEQKAAGYTDGMTLVELISGQSERGGGYDPSARLKKVLIVRGALENPTTFEVNLARILEGRDPDVFLMPGDIVYVPEKPYRFARDLTRAVVLTFVRTFSSEAGAALVDETIFITTPSSDQQGGP
jgi:polysaccharide export outer membrane protein